MQGLLDDGHRLFLALAVEARCARLRNQEGTLAIGTEPYAMTQCRHRTRIELAHDTEEFTRRVARHDGS